MNRRTRMEVGEPIGRIADTRRKDRRQNKGRSENPAGRNRFHISLHYSYAICFVKKNFIKILSFPREPPSYPTALVDCYLFRNSGMKPFSSRACEMPRSK